MPETPAPNIAQLPKAEEIFVTQREFRIWTIGTGGAVVVALGIFAMTMIGSNASAQAENRKQTNEAVAQVQQISKEIDAGVKAQLDALRHEVHASAAKHDAKLNCLIDKRFCPAARELLSEDGEP